MTELIHRGYIYSADLSENGIGSEQVGSRPVVVIQNDNGNFYSPTVIIVPITSKIYDKSILPTHIPLENLRYRMIRDSMMLTEQIRVIDKSRLRKYIGKLNNEEMKLLEAGIFIALGIENYISKDSFQENKEQIN